MGEQPVALVELPKKENCESRQAPELESMSGLTARMPGLYTKYSSRTSHKIYVSTVHAVYGNNLYVGKMRF